VINYQKKLKKLLIVEKSRKALSMGVRIWFFRMTDVKNSGIGKFSDWRYLRDVVGY